MILILIVSRNNQEVVIQSAPVSGARGIQNIVYNSKSYSYLFFSPIKNGSRLNVNMDSTLPTSGAALNDAFWLTQTALAL